MEELVERIRARLAQGAYPNEAAVSVGIVLPLLRALAWDDSDPETVTPEHSSGRGRVDFALCTPPRRPAVFVEVKGVGRSLDGDRQLFEYAFHQGVPLCVLTDGREWSFYLPGGQGSYDDRRVYRLQLDDRTPAECARILTRYLACDRVKSGQALEDASRDYRDAAARREAARALPQAWAELLDGEDLLIDLVADRAEALCGFRPTADEVLAFLRRPTAPAAGAMRARTPPAAGARITVPPPIAAAAPPSIQADDPLATGQPRGGAPGGISYTLFGATRTAANANRALVEILRAFAARMPDRLPALAERVRGPSRNHIARTPADIYPKRPDLARAEEIAPGWLVGLNISNRRKTIMIRAACEVFDAEFGRDVVITLPNGD